VSQKGDSEIENLLEFFVEGDTDNQRQLGGGVKLPRFDGAYGVSGDPYELGKSLLRYALLVSYLLKIIFKNKPIVHYIIPLLRKMQTQKAAASINSITA